MSINVTDKPEVNVVNIGEEISTDQLAAIQGAVNPNSVNRFATLNDVSAGGNPFNQDLNTTNNVEFGQVKASSGFVTDNYIVGGSQATMLYTNGLHVTDSFVGSCNIAAAGITFPDGSFMSSAGGFSELADTILRQENNMVIETKIVNGVPTISGRHLDFIQGLDINCFGITFTDGTLQTSAPVFSSGTVISGGSGSTINEGDYPNEVRIGIDGVTYAMPARII